MLKPVAFWDSSALIPLCVAQPQTTQARSLYERYGVVAWWATEVEIMSGLTRLERSGHIDHQQFLIGKQIAQEIAQAWVSVRSTGTTAAAACSLLDLHPLRAADALQLAAALEWCEGKPLGSVFLTFEKRLREAAESTGFILE